MDREFIIPQEMNQSDRIGSLTIPQAGVMGGGIMLILFMIAVIPHLVIALILDVPLAILTVYLMYKKKYNIPVYEFFFVYISYMSMPKLYLYRTDNLTSEYEEEQEKLAFLIDEDPSEEVA